MIKDNFSKILIGFLIGCILGLLIFKFNPRTTESKKNYPIVGQYHLATCIAIENDEITKFNTGSVISHGYALLECDDGLYVKVSNCDEHQLKVGDKIIIETIGKVRRDIPLYTNLDEIIRLE